MSLKNAFHFLISIHSRDMVINRPGTALTGDVKVTPSNYFRNLSAPEEIVIEGREFILSKKNLDDESFPAPKRNDRLTDPELGLIVITEVREVFDFGGDIMGYRIRSS